MERDGVLPPNAAREGREFPGKLDYSGLDFEDFGQSNAFGEALDPRHVYYGTSRSNAADILNRGSLVDSATGEARATTTAKKVGIYCEGVESKQLVVHNATIELHSCFLVVVVFQLLVDSRRAYANKGRA